MNSLNDSDYPSNGFLPISTLLVLLVSTVTVFPPPVASEATDRYAGLEKQDVPTPELAQAIETSSEESPSKKEEESEQEDETEFRDPFNGNGGKKLEPIPDPFEPINRATFWFNDKVYLYGLEPMAYGWHSVVPHYGRMRVKKFFSNLDEPKNFVNSLLQGNFFGAMVSSSRFVINSTVGIAGLYDPASRGAEPVNTGFDRTLSTWGVGTGPYVTIPILGPSTARGTIGLVADGLVYPPNYIEGEDSTLAIAGVSILRNVNRTSFRLGEYQSLKDSAVDPYAGLKNAYEQDLRNGEGFTP